ncbi:ribosomal protein S18 acetylase RimI-like enzyme [Devosia sp. UYZn731]|uniref:hypothetical protein n=1 Tax=Devosia sp. UYZn731 TaxID=3156345 RepID=UPI003398A854
MRKHLDTAVEAPVWPPGIRPAAFDSVDPRLLHAVLEEAFPGLVAPLADWYGNMTSYDEFDPALCVPAQTEDGSIAGFMQCWTSGFIKDLAVAERFRG